QHKDATSAAFGVYIGHKDIVRFLISSKADPNASTSVLILNTPFKIGRRHTPIALSPFEVGHARHSSQTALNSGATLTDLESVAKKYAKRGFLPSQEAASPTRQSAAPWLAEEKRPAMLDSSSSGIIIKVLAAVIQWAILGSGGSADDSRSAAFTAVARCVRRLLPTVAPRSDWKLELQRLLRAALSWPGFGHGRRSGRIAGDAGLRLRLSQYLARCRLPAGLRLRCRRIREGPGAWAVRLMRTSLLCNALLSMEQADCTGRLAPAAEEFINQTLSLWKAPRSRGHLVQLLALFSSHQNYSKPNFLSKFEQFADVLIGWSIDPGDSAEFALSKRLAACLTSLAAAAAGGGGGGGARADSPVEAAMAAAPLLETFATVLTALDNASCRQADDADSASLDLQRLIGLLSRLSAHLSSLSAADLALCLGGGESTTFSANQAIVSLLNAIKRRPGNGVGCLDDGLAEQLLNYLLIELMSDLSTLTSPNLPVNLVQENGFRDKRYSAPKLNRWLCSTAWPCANSAGSASRTPACLVRLQPPLFDLLATGYLPLHRCRCDAAAAPPALGPAASAAVHCRRTPTSYAYSPFCADSRTIGESDAVAAAASEDNCLQCLARCLASPGCPPKSAACAVACLTELAAAAVARDRGIRDDSDAARVARSLRLQSAPAYQSAAVRLMAACLSGLPLPPPVTWASVTSSIGTLILDSVFALLSTSDESLAAECLNSDLRGQWLGLRHHMMRTCEVTFSGPNLRLVLKYLLDGAKRPPFLYGLFLSCTPAAREAKLAEASPDFASLLGQSRHVLSFQWFWATWEVSWFCVLNKLKVPWNRAQDTFLAIEDALNRLVNQRLSANPSDWHRGYCVLLFMEQLEKLVFNAYEGCAILSGLSHFKSVKYFFPHQQVYLSGMVPSNSAHCHAAVRSSDSPELGSVSRLLGETDASRYANQDDTLLLLVKSLCRMGQADCLHGLYAWCETRLGRRLLCVRAAAERADGKLESALQLYEQHLQDLLMNGIGRPGGAAV
uniref:Non-specific serine/threonine protein kinase n=1 Tax=Macrostomum lignano TaxID=282301 RepID=A0A1I8JNN9_9PLAT